MRLKRGHAASRPPPFFYVGLEITAKARRSQSIGFHLLFAEGAKSK